MNKDQFIEEMLQEVTNLKDLAKGEIPLLAKEYIYANIYQAWIGIGIAVILLILSIISGIYLATTKFPEYSDVKIMFFIILLFSGVGGLMTLWVCSRDLLDFKLQPRRMAIKAITSLR